MTATDHAEQPDTGVAGLIARISGYLRHGGGALTAGDLAALRRMDPRRPETAFVKLATLTELPDDDRWPAIVCGLAILGEQHRRDAWFGSALAEAGFSELRLNRLLRADAERLLDELPAVARFLAAKSCAADWTGAAWLLLSAGRSNDEQSRRTVARQYFATQAQQQRR